MTKREKSDSSDKSSLGQPDGIRQKQDLSLTEPGTRGPDGPLDDQPQREDEYLSSVLKEFNPQRKDKNPATSGSAHNKNLKRAEQGDEKGTTQQGES